MPVSAWKLILLDNIFDLTAAPQKILLNIIARVG
jgi:hypothetical protein